MTSEVFQKVAAVFNGFVDIESGDGTGRSGCHVIRTCQYYCRPVIDFRQPGGYDADDAFMPVFIVQYDGTSVGKSVQVSYNLVGLLGHGLVQVLACLVVLVDLSGFLQGKREIFSVSKSTASFPFWIRPEALMRGPILNTMSLTVMSLSVSPQTSMIAFRPTLGLLFNCFKPW